MQQTSTNITTVNLKTKQPEKLTEYFKDNNKEYVFKTVELFFPASQVLRISQ